MSEARTVVIGAGIVGVCCAAFLQRQGRRVVVVDRLPPGEAPSFGNAGSISWSSCVPIAVPGLLPKVPGWLLRRDGPLTIRWRYLPRLAPWLWRFLRAGRLDRLEASSAAMAALHGMLSSYRKAFERGENQKSERFFRCLNEVPTVLVIVIVLLVVVKFV